MDKPGAVDPTLSTSCDRIFEYTILATQPTESAENYMDIHKIQH